MLVHLNALVPQLQTLFTTDAAQAAADSQFIRRQRKLTGPAFAQGLVFAWLEQPNATVDELVVSLARAGVCLKAQSLEDRFTPQSAEFFRLLLTRALSRAVAAAEPTACALLRLFEGVFLLDSSLLTLPAALAELFPGCGGRNDAASCQAALKITARYEVGAGRLEGVELNPGRRADAKTDLQTAPLPAGSLRLADLGFFDLDVLRTYDSQRVYFISRPAANLVVYAGKRRKEKLARFLARQRQDRVDAWLWVGAGQQLSCRLVAIRAPKEVAAQRRAKAQEAAQDHGRTASGQRLELCGWTVFLCNVPRWLLKLQEVWVLYRVRWQIELLFKLWKSDGQIDASRSEQPYRVLSEVYAKLVGMVVQHWLLLSCGGAAFGKHSQRKAARAVRQQMGHVAAVLVVSAELLRALAVVARMVAAAGAVNRRQGRPSTYQTLLDPDHDGLSSPEKNDPKEPRRISTS
jgi:hypothetical protein